MSDVPETIPEFRSEQIKFPIGSRVFKWTGDYTGPGIVRGISRLASGKVRYLVGHTIIGGTGEFLHVYASGNLRSADTNCEGGDQP